METLLELVSEILKGRVREVTAHLFQKNVLENKETTRIRHRQKGGLPRI